MKTIAFGLLLVGAILCAAVMPANAYILQLDAGTYEKPDGWETIASISYLSLDHWMYYQYFSSDLGVDVDQVDIVFHSLYNSAYEQNELNLYLTDYEGQNSGWAESYDAQQLDNPDWSGWAHLGTWSYPDYNPDPNANPADETYDVVFSIVDQDILQMLHNGSGFVLGIDPDCHYYGSGMSVNAPVPEPATLLLLGTGIIGLTGYGRKRNKKNT